MTMRILTRGPQTCQTNRRYFTWPEALAIRVRTTVSSVAATTRSQRRKPLIVILHQPINVRTVSNTPAISAYSKNRRRQLVNDFGLSFTNFAFAQSAYVRVTGKRYVQIYVNPKEDDEYQDAENMVEAAGVEPASENVTGQETTCLFAFMP